MTSPSSEQAGTSQAYRDERLELLIKVKKEQSTLDQMMLQLDATPKSIIALQQSIVEMAEASLALLKSEGEDGLGEGMSVSNNE